MTRQNFACCTMSYFKRFWISRSLNYPFWGLNFSLGTKKPKSFGRAEENIVAPSHEVLNFLQSGIPGRLWEATLNWGKGFSFRLSVSFWK